MSHSPEEVPGWIRLWSSDDGRASFYHQNVSDPNWLLRIVFSNEIEAEAMGRVLASLHSNPHSNICECLDWRVDGWFVDWLMPKAEKCLQDLVAQRASERANFSEEELFQLSKQLIEALAFLEVKGLAFPVIYPQFVRFSEPGIYRVCSIGISESLGSEFLSPSLKAAVSWVDKEVNVMKSCVYSVGVCLLYASLLKVCENVQQALVEMRIVYSKRWVSYVSSMLQENDSHRPSFSELNMIRDEELIEELVSYEDTQPLKVNVECGLQYVRISQTYADQVPCMITLQGKHLGPDQQDYATDLVCVIDVSGSMRGELLDQVKESLKSQLIAGMRPPDRASFITFSDEAKLHCPLIICSKEGRTRLRNIVDRFEVQDLTNLTAGFKMGLNVLKCRKTKNRKAVVLLFTDGKDNLNENATEECLKTLDEANIENLEVHCLAFEREIDQRLFEQIEQRGKGMCKQIFQIEKINEAFRDAFKEFSTEIARNIKIDLEKNVDSCIAIKSHDIFCRRETKKARIARLFASEEKHITFLIVPEFKFLSKEAKIVPAFVQINYEDASGSQCELKESLNIYFVPWEGRAQSNYNDLVYDYFYQAQANNVIVKAKRISKDNKEEACILLFEQIEYLSAKSSEHYQVNAGLIAEMQNLISKIRGIYDYDELKKIYVSRYSFRHESQRGIQRSIESVEDEEENM